MVSNGVIAVIIEQSNDKQINVLTELLPVTVAGSGDKLHSQKQLFISIRLAVGVNLPPWGQVGFISQLESAGRASPSVELTFTSCCVI